MPRSAVSRSRGGVIAIGSWPMESAKVLLVADVAADLADLRCRPARWRWPMRPARRGASCTPSAAQTTQTTAVPPIARAAPTRCRPATTATRRAASGTTTSSASTSPAATTRDRDRAGVADRVPQDPNAGPK